jgi:hypothetical protein
MEQFDEPLRVEGLILYRVETCKKGSRNFDESLPVSSFEGTLAGGAKRGWASKSDLLGVNFIHSARDKLRETERRATNRKHNDKRTAKGIVVGNKKRTAANPHKQYQERTPDQTDATELRRRPKRAERREVDDNNREKLLMEVRAGMEVDAYDWPNALSKSPTSTASALRRSVGTQR